MGTNLPKEPLDWYLVKCLSEVQEDDVRRLAVVRRRRDLVQKGQQVASTRFPSYKTVLAGSFIFLTLFSSFLYSSTHSPDFALVHSLFFLLMALKMF